MRAELAMRRRCRKNELNPIRGLSRQTLNEIVRIEETRNYLWPGTVGESLPRRAARELRVLVLELDEAY